MNAMGTLRGAGWMVLSCCAFASASNRLEDLADRLEDKTDSLWDVIDDRFERAPDYRMLSAAACRAERAADDLEDALDDQNWGRSAALLAQVQAEVAVLAEVVPFQPACHVHPKYMNRAQCLIREINETVQCIQREMMACHAPVEICPHHGPELRGDRLPYAQGRGFHRVARPSFDRRSANGFSLEWSGGDEGDSQAFGNGRDGWTGRLPYRGR